MVRGTRWECGYCGDFGAISSLQPSEKAKLVHAAAPSIWLSITVTDASDEEDSPRSFSRAELKDMDTQDLLTETGEKDLEAAIDMMKLLLDTVGTSCRKGKLPISFWAGTWTASCGISCPRPAAAAAENRRPSG